MKNLERIWLLVLGIAVAMAIAIAALVWPGATTSPNAGTGDKNPAILSKPDPSVVLKKVIENIHLDLPAR